MGPDASIYSLIRPVQGVEDPIKQVGQAMNLNTMLGQQDLQQLQTGQLRKNIATEEAVSNAIRQSRGDPAAIREAYLKAGDVKGLQAFEKAQLENRKTQSGIDKDQVDIVTKNLAMLGGALGQLGPNPSPEAVGNTLNTLKASGALTPQGYEQLARSIPADPAQMPNFVRGIVTMTEHGLKTLEALAPKVTMVDNGQQITPTNTNTLSGPVGPIQGAAPLQKQATPGEVMTDTRTRSEGAANRGVTIRGQDLTDARAREQAARSGQHYDADRGVIVNTNTNTASPVTLGGAPLPAKIPESSKKEAASIDAQANTVAKALEYVKATPEAFGMGRGMATAAGAIPEALAMKASGTEANQARAFVYNVVSKVINERAGAAQSKQELARLRGFLPSEFDDAKVIQDKLTGFESYLAEQRKAYSASPMTAGASGGWKIEREK